jgi:hypothetical protein
MNTRTNEWVFGKFAGHTFNIWKSTFFYIKIEKMMFIIAYKNKIQKFHLLLYIKITSSGIQ